MVNEIVKYENRLNSIPLRKFNSREMNLFFSIASRVRDKGTTEITFTFEDLRNLSKNGRHGETFVQDLSSTYDKLLSLSAWTDDGRILTKFVAFTEYSINREKQIVTIAVNPKFKGLFNQLSTWTRFGLEQFVNLRSTYSKTLFRLIKQYRTVGRRDFTIQDFRAILDIPKSYRTTDIDRRVLKICREELSPIFKGLSIKKLHKGRGNKVTGYSFTWKAEANDQDDFSKSSWYEVRKKITNIENNNSLTEKEKQNSKTRVYKNYSPKPIKQKETLPSEMENNISDEKRAQLMQEIEERLKELDIDNKHI
ncbi:replication protein [Lactobacillus acetotolerans]|uniref:Replication protein n=1 Tax=Lactobacillus acetotolerans TaxID=1600 RepID=A0A0D6A1V4_9LACO|nr:replication initiation protein [Lactobacillus acetotolerans]BAQ56792.1 replication protein [Lactobacillus acetotolerans]